MKFSGDLKTITDPWEEFDSNGNNTGHFVPIQLPTEFIGKDYTFKGKAKDATLHVGGDRLLVIRLENLTTLKPYIEKDGRAVLRFDMTDLVPKGEKAYDANKTDFGGYGRTDILTDNLQLEWTGEKAKAHGKLKCINGKNPDAAELTEAGYYFPLSLSDWFVGTPHKVGIEEMKETTDKDVICKVTTQYSNIKVTYLDTTVMDINLRGMILEIFDGEDAVDIAPQETDMDDNIKASDLIDEGATISWDDTTGKVTGTLKYYKMPENRFNGAEGHFFPFVVSGYDGEEIEYVGIGGLSVKANDTKAIFQADGASPDKKAKIKVNRSTIAEIDLSGMTMAPKT